MSGSNEAAFETSSPSDAQPKPKPGWLRIGAPLALIAAVGGGIAFWATRHSEAAAPTAADASRRDVPRLDGALIRYSREFAERSGIKVATAEMTALSPMVTVTGTATFDPEETAAVGARIAGRIRNVKKFEGDKVKAGDVLADIESAELGQAQAAVLSARAHADTATANEKRERQLADAKISAEREAELARASAAASRAELYAAEQKVRALGGEPSGEIGILHLRSPIAGKVVDRKVSRGQSVEPTLTAFHVANLTKLWVELAVFERELGAIREGDAVEISPQTDAHKIVKGKVAHVGDVIDLDTRSAHVRVEVENPDESLRPGQSVIAKIHTAVPVKPALVVPRDAVIIVDGKPTLFVAHDDTSVEPRVVVLGSKDATRVEVTSGLNAGESLVTHGVFALKSELFR